MDSVAGGCRLGLGFVPPRGPGIVIMGVGGSDLSGVGLCGDMYNGGGESA